MSDHTTIDTPLIPGIRRVVSADISILASSINRIATELIPANSILRSVLFAADISLEQVSEVRLRLSTGNTTSPAANDFEGTGRILPTEGLSGSVVRYSADPAVSARDLPYNFELPDHTTRILIEVENNLTQAIFTKLRLVIDGLGRIGGIDARR